MTTTFDEDAFVYSVLERDILAAVKGKRGPEAVARAIHGVLRATAESIGQKPDIETAIWPPNSRCYLPPQDGWIVNWEAGPHDWAIGLSFALIEATGLSVEPYYGFDLVINAADKHASWGAR